MMTWKGRMLRKLVQNVQRSKGCPPVDAASADLRLLLNILTTYLPPAEALFTLIKVCKSWKRFLLATVHEVRLSRVNLSNADLRSLADYSRITVLDVSGNTQVTDLSCLVQKLTALTDLNVVNTGITSLDEVVRVGHSTLKCVKLNGCIPLDPLAMCTGLEHLEVVTSHSKDFSCITTGLSLRTLRYTRCRSDQDFLQICSFFSSLQELILEGCIALMDISHIQHLQRLTSLKLHNLDVLRDLSPISKLCRLTELELKHLSLVETLPQELANLKDLKRLALSGFRGKEIPQLAFYAHLEALELSRCERLTCLGSLQACTPLRRLSLTNCHALLDLSAFQKVTSLSHLTLRSCHALTSVAGISGSASSLRRIDILWMNSVSRSLQPLLGCCTCLEVLDLSGGSVFDWDGGTQYPSSVKELCLVDAKPDPARSSLLQYQFKASCFARIEALSLKGSLVDSLWTEPSLHTIRRLDLSANDLLVDISPLKILASSLISLNLSYCSALADISVLRMMKKLIRLDLSSCTSVGSVDWLEDVASTLEVLSLENCIRLRTFAPLRSCNMLRLLNVSRCASQDPSALALLSGLELLDVRGIDLPEKMHALLEKSLSGCYIRFRGPLFTVWTEVS